MVEQIYFEQYTVGTERHTIGRTITETDIVLHAGQTGDFFPHHMDAEWCKKQPFRQRMAHGTLIFSIAVGMSAHLINEVAISYGYERLRFIKPIFISDTITVHICIKEKADYKRPENGLVTEGVRVVNQHGDTVMVCDHILLVKRQPPQ